jgi:hypothetical protein
VQKTPRERERLFEIVTIFVITGPPRPMSEANG